MKMTKGILLVVSLFALVPLLAETQNLFLHKSSPTVYDANGKTVGTMLDASFTTPESFTQGWVPTVAFKSGQLDVFLGVFPNRLSGNQLTLFFTTADCSGTAYFTPPPGAPSLISLSYVKNDGTVYAAPGDSSPLTTVSITSFIQKLDYRTPGPELCTPNYYDTAYVIQAEELGNINDMFQPPFVLR